MTTSSEIARTYSRVLFDLAAAADAVDGVDAGLVTVVEAVRGHIDLRTALSDAQVSAEKKRDVLRGIFGEQIAPEVLAIVTLVVDRGHVGLLGDIAREYAEIAQKERNIVVAEVTTAITLDNDMRDSLIKKLSAQLDRPVSLREKVDASILGGAIVRVAGRVLDGSLSSQLESMRTTLSNASPGGEA